MYVPASEPITISLIREVLVRRVEVLPNGTSTPRRRKMNDGE